MHSTSNIIGKIQQSPTQQDKIDQLEKQRRDLQTDFQMKDRELLEKIKLLKKSLPADNGSAYVTNDLYHFSLEGGEISYEINDKATPHADAINNAMKADDPNILRSLIQTAIDRVTFATYNLNTNEEDDYLKLTVKDKIINVIGTNKRGELEPFYADLKYGFHPITIGFLTKRSQPLLIEAILLGSSQCATLLLNEFGADPSTPYYHVVHSSGSYSYVSYDQECEALALAIDRNLTDVALLLIQKGADLNGIPLTGFIKHVTDTSSDSIRGLTPLMLGTMKNNDIIVKTLLEKGAQYDRLDRNRKNAMQLATSPTIIDLFNAHISKDEEALHEEISECNKVMQMTKSTAIITQSQKAVKAAEEKLSNIASLRKSMLPTNTATLRF